MEPEEISSSFQERENGKVREERKETG